MIDPRMMGQGEQPQEAPEAAPGQMHVLMDMMPFKGLDTWRSPLQMQANYLTDMSFVALDELLSAISTAKGRADLFTGFTTPLGMDVFYPQTNPQAFMFLVDANGWHQIDYIGLTAQQNVTLPSGAAWSNTAQTYFATLNHMFVAANGINPPLKIRDDWNTAAPAAQFCGIVAPTSAPTVAAAAGSGNLNGSYRWRVTFQNSNAFGQESAQGPFTDLPGPLTLTNQAASLTAIPTSTDPQVNQRNIYRIGGSIPEWRLVGTINDNVTTTAVDNVSDLSLGQLLIFDRQPMPAGLSIIIEHKSRLFGFIGNNLQFTYYNEPESWPPQYVLPIGDSDPIVTLGKTSSALVVFKKNDAHVIAGQTLSDFVVLKVADVGCIGPRAVFSTEGEVFFLANDGLRAISFLTGKPQIRLVGTPIWKTIRDITPAAKKTAVLAYGRGKLIVAFPDANISLSSGSAAGPLTLVFDMKVGDWEREKNPIQMIYGFPRFGEWEKYPFAPRHIVPLFASSDPEFFAMTEYTTQPTFNIRQWPTATYVGDLGASTSWYFERKQWGGGSGKLVKRYRELEVIAPAQSGISVTVTLTVDDDSVNKQTTMTIDLSKAPKRWGLPPNMVGKYITVRVSGTHTQQVIIDGIRIWGWIEHLYDNERTQ